MKKSIFAVCDLEASYTRNLADYMNERSHTPFEVQAFTNLKSLEEFVAQNHIDLLLISTNAMCDQVKQMDVDRIMILSEGEAVPRLGQEPCVYKYQPSDQLIAEVMGYYAQTCPQPALEPMEEGKTEIIGVYSPLGRVGKTIFALTLGAILGENRKVLYLNLEDYNGFETLLDQSYSADLSDLLYFARQKEGNLIYKLSGMIRSIGKLDYIPPAFSPCDLRDVRCEEWLSFLRQIGAWGDYEVLILDLGNQIEDVFRIMRQCGRVYMPVLEDKISRAKLLQFEKNLSALECADVLEKIVRLHLPLWEGEAEQRLPESLGAGELAQYVRKLLEAAPGEAQTEDSDEMEQGKNRMGDRTWRRLFLNRQEEMEDDQ